MAAKDLTIAPQYENLIENISSLLKLARQKAVTAVNDILVQNYPKYPKSETVSHPFIGVKI